MPTKRKPAYLLHQATGQARVRIDRKDHYLGVFGSQESRDRYDDLIAEWLGLRKGKTYAREPKPVRPVAAEVVDATVTHLPAVVADMVRFQRLTGCRPGEVCQIRPCDLDQSGATWVYTPTRHKTEHHDRQRQTFLGPQAQAVLLPYLRRSPEDFCFSPSESERQRRAERHASRKTPLSQGNRPQPARPRVKQVDCYTKDSYRRAIARACEVAFGMPRELRSIAKNGSQETIAELRRRAAEWRARHCWTPNQLRHAAATEIRRQFGLEAAQAVLGHRTADVTQIYAERDQRLAAAVAREIG